MALAVLVASLAPELSLGVAYTGGFAQAREEGLPLWVLMPGAGLRWREEKVWGSVAYRGTNLGFAGEARLAGVELAAGWRVGDLEVGPILTLAMLWSPRLEDLGTLCYGALGLSATCGRAVGPVGVGAGLRVLLAPVRTPEGRWEALWLGYGLLSVSGP